MKIRKILPLVLLAVGSVFLLSSCDAILDAMFSNNTVNVYVSSRILTYGYFPSTDSVTAYISGPSAVTATAGYAGTDGYYMYWNISIPKLADGTYLVEVDYYHPFGNFASGIPYTKSQPLYLPASSGSPHNVNVVFAFP
jgi:hypothetical protein